MVVTSSTGELSESTKSTLQTKLGAEDALLLGLEVTAQTEALSP